MCAVLWLISMQIRLKLFWKRFISTSLSVGKCLMKVLMFGVLYNVLCVHFVTMENTHTGMCIWQSTNNVTEPFRISMVLDYIQSCINSEKYVKFEIQMTCVGHGSCRLTYSFVLSTPFPHLMSTTSSLAKEDTKSLDNTEMSTFMVTRPVQYAQCYFSLMSSWLCFAWNTEDISLFTNKCYAFNIYAHILLHILHNFLYKAENQQWS